MKSDTKNDEKGLFGSLFKSKKATVLLVIGVIAGLILIFIGSGDGKSEQLAAPELTDQISISDEYIKNLEIRVTQILSKMDGISNVSVIITADSGIETVYAKNERYDSGSLSEKEYVIIDDNPISITLVYPKIRGVAIVCTGGSNPINQERISKLISSLFDIAQNQVYISG